MKNNNLDHEEQKLLEAVEAGEFESTLTPARKAELEAMAAKTFTKDKRINIRITNRDLDAIKSKAQKEGIPYQTLISSIIHKYISGSLQDVATK
ncbi:CopG family antitoxin [Endozoicomonas euniceicola]|uniref:CopG family antitoxin n=1 Tax=Endozoicomonas euniceicola TaxID=1234143 RepID=A0ABY6H322_9GAMM|nr:CopG family antitoxin [Endozoicomonas euniceicola]UYM18529.1 CopG family antitoxin [Endozoicomonas euniceicola]